MLNFSNTLKSKTIIILQIFIIVLIGFYIKKNYFSNKIESFYFENNTEQPKQTKTPKLKPKIIFETNDKDNTKEKINLIYNDYFEREKSYSYHCLLELKNKDNKYLFNLDDETHKIINIQNTNDKFIIILYEGENYEGNFMIIDNKKQENKIIDITNFIFKSFKIINKDYLTEKTQLQYFQDIADKHNDILLFTDEEYNGLCYRIRLQPNEIEDFETDEGKTELKRFKDFFENTNIKSIILPGVTDNQNDRTFRNILLQIIIDNTGNTGIKEIKNNQKKVDYKIGDISKYKVLARYAHLDTKTANKNLRQNELQLKKLKALLNKKIDEMVEKQEENEEYEDKVMDSLLNRVFDKINNNFDRANYFKDH